MKNKIEEIRKIFDEQMKANKALNEEENHVQNDAAYSAEYKSELLKKLEEEHFEKSIKRRDAIIKGIEELFNMEKTIIDIVDVKLNNAVNLIKTLGDAIPVESLKDIENQFRGEQASLKLLIGAYETMGLSTVRLEKISYDVKTTYNDMAQDVYKSFEKPQYISKLSGTLAMLKHIEEVCEPLPREKAIMEPKKLPTMF